jgi:hypothetical protein
MNQFDVLVLDIIFSFTIPIQIANTNKTVDETHFFGKKNGELIFLCPNICIPNNPSKQYPLRYAKNIVFRNMRQHVFDGLFGQDRRWIDGKNMYYGDNVVLNSGSYFIFPKHGNWSINIRLTNCSCLDKFWENNQHVINNPRYNISFHVSGLMDYLSERQWRHVYGNIRFVDTHVLNFNECGVLEISDKFRAHIQNAPENPNLLINLNFRDRSVLFKNLSLAECKLLVSGRVLADAVGSGT